MTDDDLPRTQAEWDQFHAGVRDQLHRMKNPPWWDLANRSVNHTLRMEKAFVEGDRSARRWVLWGLPVRFLLAMALVITLPQHLDDSWQGTAASIALGMSGAFWALHAWGRAITYERAYRHGYETAQDEILDRLREQGRLRW